MKSRGLRLFLNLVIVTTLILSLTEINIGRSGTTDFIGPNELTLGGLFALTGGSSGGGVEREAAFRMAVNEINSRNDILPNTVLKYEVKDTASSAGVGATVAAELVNLDVFGVVGAASSSISIAVAPIFAAAEIPQISYASTVRQLSNKTEYPYFSRVVGPDILQGIVLADIIFNDYGIANVNTLNVDDEWSNDIINEFTLRYTELGGTINQSQVFSGGSLDVTTELGVLANGSNYTVFQAWINDAVTVFTNASTIGLTSANGHQFFTTDGPLQSSTISVLQSLALDDINGTIGLQMSLGKGEIFTHFKDMWECADPGTFSGAGDRIPNNFAGPSYDAVFAFAWAAHQMINRQFGGDPTDGPSLLNEIKGLSFTGVTGLVRFDSNQDRLANYEVNNLKGSEITRIAIWDDLIGYTQFGNVTFADNSIGLNTTSNDPTQDPAGHIADCSEFYYNEPAFDPAAVIQVGIVFSVGGLGDLGFNDAAYAGMIRAAEANPRINITYYEPDDVNDITNTIELFASRNYDLVLGIGFGARTGIENSANNHPTVNFMIIDEEVDLPNVASVRFREQEVSFLVGALAAMVTQTYKVAFFGGMDIPLINRFGAGFEHGVKYINSTINVTIVYSPDDLNPWGDFSGGETTALELYNQSIDIIFTAAGGTGLGAIQAASDLFSNGSRVYVIGVDSNQDGLAPGAVLTSAIKNIDTAVENNINDLAAGVWKSGISYLGISNNGLDITEMEFTSSEKNTIFEGLTTRYEKVLELMENITQSQIIVASDYTELATINFVNNSENLPILQTIVTDTITVTDTTSEINTVTDTITETDTITDPNPVTDTITNTLTVTDSITDTLTVTDTIIDNQGTATIEKTITETTTTEKKVEEAKDTVSVGDPYHIFLSSMIIFGVAFAKRSKTKK